jgi:type I restriction enzyme S subunit
MEEKIEFYKEIEFKDTEIGKIPKEWEVVKLGIIAKISSGNTAPQEGKYFKNGRHPFIRVQHLKGLQEGKFPVNYDFINDYALSELKLKLFKKGCIIFPKSGESIKLEKRAMLKEDSYVVNHLAVIEPIYGSVDNLFLFYYLRKIKTSDYLTETTTPSLKLSTISNFLVPFPPLIEQQKIAEILSTVDEAIQRTDDVIAKTESLKKGLMQELLTKGIGHKEFKDTEIGRIPKEWEVVKLKDVLLLLRNGITLRQIKEGNGYPVTRIETISEEKIDPSKLGYVVGLHEKDIEEYRLIEGDILFSHINSLEHIGKTAIYEGEPGFILHGMNLLLLRPDKNKVDTKFLLYLLRLFRARRVFGIMAKKAVNQASINQTELGNLKIFLPPLSEQQKIASILSNVYEKLENLRRERTKLEKIKQWFMEELLSGRIRVRVA